MILRLPISTLFPYTTLFRSGVRFSGAQSARRRDAANGWQRSVGKHHRRPRAHSARRGEDRARADEDRKSTRLNSSHRCISYAVFCLKKKNIMKKSIYWLL